MKLYGAQILRETVDRNIRVILSPVTDHWRKVQIQAPADVQALVDTFDLTAGLYTGEGPDKREINTEELVPLWYGHNRAYKLPQFYPISNQFKIAPGQVIVACAATGFETLTLIVECTHPPRVE